MEYTNYKQQTTNPQMSERKSQGYDQETSERIQPMRICALREFLSTQYLEVTSSKKEEMSNIKGTNPISHGI